MATVIAEFPAVTRAKREPKYPLDQWFDGQIYHLTEGEDFTAKVESIQSYLSGKARERGHALRTSIVDGGLVIQVTGKAQASSKRNGKAASKK